MSRRHTERREEIRFDVEGLQGGLRLPMDARVVDLSSGGLGVETDRWLQVGRRYTVSLPTREDGKTLRVPGRVAWCTLARTERNSAGEVAPIYKAGIQFHEPDPATVEAIESLLSRAARVGMENRTHGRFRYRREAALDVEFEHAFTVRTLSLTGMLVDADVLLGLEERFQVALHVDDEVLEVTTRVAYTDRSRGLGSEPTSRIGLEFVDLDAAQRKLLGEIVRRRVASSTASFVGNPTTSVFHRPSCRHAVACTASFRTRRQAEAAGFRPGSCCSD